MSIVNDALKKAGKEFEFNAQDVPALNQKTALGPGKKWPVMIPAMFIVVAFLFAAFILYKNAHEPDPDYSSGGTYKSSSAVQSTLNSIERKDAPKPIRSHNIAKLNGIVYGDEGKWAIVDNKIVKEGDNLLGGEIVSIARDFVKIEKKDGSEIVLGLK